MANGFGICNNPVQTLAVLQYRSRNTIRFFNDAVDFIEIEPNCCFFRFFGKFFKQFFFQALKCLGVGCQWLMGCNRLDPPLFLIGLIERSGYRRGRITFTPFGNDLNKVWPWSDIAFATGLDDAGQ